MENKWLKHLHTNPLPVLLGANNPGIIYFVERDLLVNQNQPANTLWDLPEVRKILSRQRLDGSWLFRGKRPGDEFGEAYELIETWKILRALIEMYAFSREHPGIERACEYIFSYQTEEGDIRGILSNQYAPYYTGAILEILIKAGYVDDSRVEKGLKWLLSMRQEDGGWIIPLTMFKMRDYYRLFDQPPVQPNKRLPFSHMATGMVIRGFAAHPVYRKSPEAIRAGNLLKSRFFHNDAYTSRQAVSYWFKFQFPFWWTDLLTVMDSLMRMEFDGQDAGIQKGIRWFIENQNSDGCWPASYGGASRGEAHEWVTLAVCRVLKYFFG